MASQTGRRAVSELFAELLRDESGVSITEYGVLVALLSVGVIAGYEAVGAAMLTLFNKLGTNMAAPFQ